MGSERADRARSIFLSEQLGLIPPHELPDVATSLLLLGYDSPSLRELAGLPKGDRAEAAGMWQAVRQELGLPGEADEDAARFLLTYWARHVADGRIDVLEGSRLMLRVGWFPLGQPKELNRLWTLLDDWDDIPTLREQIASELRVFARELLIEQA
jgi:hypothetical protein